MANFTWTFVAYWNSVVGSGTAEDAVREHGLTPDDVGEWLIAAEKHALSEGGAISLPESPLDFPAFRTKAEWLLEEAAEQVCCDAANEVGS